MDYDDVRKTKKFCHYRGDGENLEICSHAPQWKICNEEKKLKLKVCDKHLAWGIRKAGYPVYVDSEIQELILEKD